MARKLETVENDPVVEPDMEPDMEPDLEGESPPDMEPDAPVEPDMEVAEDDSAPKLEVRTRVELDSGTVLSTEVGTVVRDNTDAGSEEDREYHEVLAEIQRAPDGSMTKVITRMDPKEA